jgi:ATP-dependent DNA helicase DinG
VPEVPALPGTPDLGAAVAAVFADAGVLSRALPAFEPRPGQREMAAAVARLFAEGGVLLAEAGTGTGKTLAYLVPAILSRERTLVSTGTKNLQEQIFYKDLPVVADALGVPFKAAYMKGRGNYLCLHRFEMLVAGGASRTPDDRLALRLIADWVDHTETGDRAEIEDLPDDLPVWNEIAASGENCIGTECPRYDTCFVTRMRQRAAEADLVVVNHHLLCADAAVRQSAWGEVIPTCRFAILDEAHQLEDVATQYFGLAVSNYRLLDLARDVERITAGGLVGEPLRAVTLREDATRVRERARVFFETVVAARGAGRPAPDRRARAGEAPRDHRPARSRRSRRPSRSCRTPPRTSSRWAAAPPSCAPTCASSSAPTTPTSSTSSRRAAAASTSGPPRSTSPPSSGTCCSSG